MSKLKKAVIQNMQNSSILKKQAKVIKIAESGPIITTQISNRNFSMLDTELLDKLANQVLSDIEFDVDAQQSFIEWTIDAQVKVDQIEIKPIIKSVKIVGKITGDRSIVYEDENSYVEIPNIELPISKENIKIDKFSMENGIIKIFNLDFYKGMLNVAFWDQEI